MNSIPTYRLNLLKALRPVLLLPALFLLPANTIAQISAPEADHTEMLEYPVASSQDPLFVFYRGAGSPVTGSLTATAPVAGSFDFDWSAYNAVTGSFSVAVGSESGVTSSTISGLDDGGYRVRITNGIDLDTTFTAWVMLDDLDVETEKDALGQVPANKSGCPDGNFLVIGGTAEVDSFFYYDPVSADTIRYQNDIDIQWTSDNPDLFIPNATNKDAMEENYTSDPPVIDTWYILTVTDSLGMAAVDSVLYDTKHTKAEFEVEYWDKVTNQWDPDLNADWSLDKGSLDAPLRVRFNNRSLSGIEFEWVFVDTVEEATDIRFVEDDFTYDTITSPEYTYLTADEYFYPYMVSTSDQGCTDTFRLEDGVYVEPVTLEIPNFFTPNGDGINDTLIFKHQSLRSCTITIIDRFGKMVYNEKIDDIYQWNGWDGNLFSGLKAPEGRYYYIVRALGYDNREYKDPGWLERRKIEKETGAGSNGGGGNNGGTSGEDGPQVTTTYTGWIYLYRHLNPNLNQ